MILYIINLLIIPLYGLIKNKKISVFMISFQLFLFLAFRSIETGVDLINYNGGYEYIASLDFHQLLSRLNLFKVADLVYPYSYESGYVILNWLSSSLGFSFHSFLVIIAFFTMLSVGVFIYRYSSIPWLSFILFIGLGMYIYSFGILRQTIAMCILLWSVPYIERNNYKKAIIILMLAFTVHRNCIIFVLLFLFNKIRITKYTVTKYLIVCFILIIVSPLIYNYVISKFLIYLGKTSYVTSDFRINNQIILIYIIAILVVNFVNIKAFNNKTNRMTFWAFLLTIPFQILGMNNDGFARIIEYYYVFAIILIPFTISNYACDFDYNGNIIKKNLKKREITNIFIPLLIIFSMLLLMVQNLTDTILVPYIIYNFKIIKS